MSLDITVVVAVHSMVIISSRKNEDFILSRENQGVSYSPSACNDSVDNVLELCQDSTEKLENAEIFTKPFEEMYIPT